MKITVIGSAGSVSGPDSAASSYLVQATQDGVMTSLVLDLGSGAYGQLSRYIDPGAVKALLLSHLHPDHVADTTSLEVHLKYAPTGPYPIMPVYGPAGTAARLVQLTGTCSEPARPDDAPFPFEITTWRTGTVYEFGPLTVEAFEVEHPLPAYAFRVTGPSDSGNTKDGSTRRVFTYSGDTDSCAGLIEAAIGADLFLCEAAFEEGRDTVRGIHLTGRRAGQAATEAGVRRLALTHIPPWTSAGTVRAEACTEYSGPIDIAEPGVTWVL